MIKVYSFWVTVTLPFGGREESATEKLIIPTTVKPALWSQFPRMHVVLGEIIYKLHMYLHRTRLDS